MSDSSKPRRPDGLQARGRRFWDHVLATYELSDGEAQVLVETCRAIDVCEDLARRARKRDVSDVVRVSLYRELRQQRAALHRLLAGLELPTEDDRSLDSPKTARARKAATARWGQFRAAYGDGA